MSQGKDRLKQIRKALSMSQGEFAESIGIPVSTINSIEGGKQKLSVRVALAMKSKVVKQSDRKLCILDESRLKQFDDAELSIDWLVAGIGEPFDKIINNDILLIQCGEKEIRLPLGENIIFYTVNDDSMYPDFFVNEYVAIDKNQKEISNGDIYLIDYNNIQALRKIYILNKDKYNLVSINDKVMTPVEVSGDEITIIGKWIYKIRVSEQ